jgi:hypothetical protein
MLGRPAPADLRRPPPRPVRISSNRDWIIPVECGADGVLLPTAGQHFELKELKSGPADANPLLLAVKRLIDRRQATVRAGELEYRPQIRFLVSPNGLRAYYLAYPALGYLHITMTRELKEEAEEK